MARKMTEWPSKRGPITKIMPSDGCIGDTVPLAVGKWYEFHEFGWHMGNVGSNNLCLTAHKTQSLADDDRTLRNALRHVPESVRDSVLRLLHKASFGQDGAFPAA